jgi:octaheme c-type cytochrome (tetrathionate reductase family)
MKRISTRLAAALCFAGWLGLSGLVTADEAKSVKLTTTADHSKFKELQKAFNSGPEVTKACIACHTEASKQIHKTQHWTWEFVNPQTKQRLGKRNVINNFCTSVASNYKGCASCHIGYGVMKDGEIDLTSEENVDCLACHDTTGKYKKPSGFAGSPVTKDTEFPPGSGKIVRGIDLTPIAQKIGKTSRATCGACHFNGGGGDGVKHGDLDTSLEKPEKKLDVHMDIEGNNFTCATCHKTEGHQVPGSRYNPTGQDTKGAIVRGEHGDRNPATCQACHGQAPHKTELKLNNHTAKVACQTCHIPKFARGEVPTKMSWDWSTAGKRDEKGKPLVITNDDGHPIYNGIKGDFVLGENVTPDYVWLNGKVDYTLSDTEVDKSMQPIYINKFQGSPTDGKSLIWPVKTFTGKQAFDPVSKRLVVTHLAGADDTAYWTNLNWEKAVASGQATVNRSFSGKVDFIETVSQWPITHMVAPKEDAVKCNECHTRGGRLDKVPGIYIPGRDHNPIVELLGWLAAAGALAAILLHGAIRVMHRKH